MTMDQYEKEKIKKIIYNHDLHQKVRENNRPKAFIGIGGLGGKTVDQLKGLCLKELNSSHKLYFMVLDSDEHELNDLKYIQETEKIYLHHEVSLHLLRKEPWMDIDEDYLYPPLNGPQTMPQVGRAIFLKNKQIRMNMERLVHELIGHANNGVDIFVISGAGGGTGAGMIVDLAYMIHHIFDQYHFSDYRLISYLYTHQDSRADANVNARLRTITYATLKQIDHFMSGIETYQMQQGSHFISIRKKIFNHCQWIHCENVYPYEEMTYRVANQLLDICVENTQLDCRLYESNAMELTSLLTNHPQRCYYPRYVNYDYMTMGHISFIIPTKEVLNYAYAKLFSSIYHHYLNGHDHIEDIKAELGFERLIQWCGGDKDCIEKELHTITKAEIREDFDIAYKKALFKVACLKLPSVLEMKDMAKKVFDDFLLEDGPHSVCHMLYGNNGLINHFHRQLEEVYERLQRGKYELEFRKEEVHMAGYECTKILVFDKKRDDYFHRSLETAWFEGVVYPMMENIISFYQWLIDYLDQFGDKMKTYALMIDEIHHQLLMEGNYFGAQKRFTPFEMDVFALPNAKENQVKIYLDQLISQTNTKDLMRTFNERLMSKDDFTATSMMDEVKYMFSSWLTNVNLDGETADKFVMLAYLPIYARPNSVADFNVIWNDHSPFGLKEIALLSASNALLSQQYMDQALWNTHLILPLTDFPHQVLLTGAKLAPNLSLKLAGNYTHLGDLQNSRIQITTQYRRIPLFNYPFTAYCHETYLQSSLKGIDMDARMNWRHMYYPFVEDVRGKFRPNTMNIKDLMEVKEMVDLGFDRYGFIRIDGNTMVIDELHMPENYEITHVSESDIEFKSLMMEYGCETAMTMTVENPLMIDMTRRDFEDIHTDPILEDTYDKQTVMIPDLYKWIYKSKTYTDLIRRNYEICTTFEKSIKEKR